MQEIKAVIRLGRLDAVLHALHEMDLPGVTISEVRGVGRRLDVPDEEVQYGEVRMAKLEIVVPESLVTPVITAIETAARTGRPGDGKVFVSPVSDALRIRTGDRDDAALE